MWVGNKRSFYKLKIIRKRLALNRRWASTISQNRMQKLAHWLLVIGGLNWLLVGLLSWDIGQLFGGQDAVVSRVIYILVGISALVSLKPKSSSAPMSSPM